MSINKQISRYETTAVYTHPDAKVDIVLVHGLNGAPKKTWTARNGTYWPTDLLPIALRDARANILVYGYNADVYSKKHGSSPSDNFIYMHAQTLVTALTHYRKDEQTSQNAIIWVCHSLGGILVKRALLYSNDLKSSQHEDYRSLYVSTYGIVFLGTPHTGSDMAAWATVLQAMSDAVMPKTFFQSESVLLKTLKKDNETLQNINNHFLDIYQRFKILMAHENHKTDIKGSKMLVVDANSAGPQLPGVTYYAIEATHSTMCKFEDRSSPGFRTIATAIRDWVLDAPDVIVTRWRVESEEKLARAKHEIEERMKPWIQSQIAQQGQSSTNIPHHMNDTTLPTSQTSPDLGLENQDKPPLLLQEGEPPPHPESPSRPSTSSNVPPSGEPIFVKPAVFRPNLFFKGRDQEMKQLHNMLTDRERRSSGTSSVLIQSMPGGGKSHLARQYVFQYRNNYPGGVFWIRAKSVKELEYGYWDIAKTAGIRDAGDIGDGDEEKATRRMVIAVRSWLNSTKNWLLILDGIHFDFPDLQYYIPFTSDTSIIFTSTERTVAEAYQFDYPQVIELSDLTKQDALELLLEEMGKKKPWTQDDLSRAGELVELVDRLPLMIHVAALHLRATREPLAKYVRSFKNRPRAGNLPAYHEVRKQLQNRGAFAALNLMYILSFFGQHIPVEMVALGARALGRSTPVKSSSPDNRRSSLNNTLQILIAFALIERYQNNEASSASSRSNRSIDVGQDNLDILRVHGIVQAFFVDVLADEKEAPFWLEQAVAVFCKAFEESKRRVNNYPQTGMPQDFRRFRIHGERLIEHLDRFQKRAPGHLGNLRSRLEPYLSSIATLVDQLEKRNSDSRSQNSHDMAVSVFERTNSQSEAESSTPPSNNSVLEFYSEENTPLESPTMYTSGGDNPYHWHVTYPYGMHYTVEEELDISRSVTPKPAPSEVFDAISMPDDDELVPRVLGSHHRTIKKHAARRYRDHAGAWRASPQIISDPRVSISRETAKGAFSTAQSQRTVLPISSSEDSAAPGSEAEVALNQISRASPAAQNPDSAFGSITADGQTVAPTARPRLIAGRTSYASASASEPSPVDEHEISPTFSNVIGTSPAPSSTYTAATITRLKENEHPGGRTSVEGLAPVKVSSPLTAEPITRASLHEQSPPTSQGHGNPEPPREHTVTPDYVENPLSPSIPIGFPGSRPESRSRSARSSPSHRNQGPFAPPPLPIEVNTRSSLRPSPPPHATRAFDPYLGSSVPAPEHEHVIDDEPLTHSLPSLRTYQNQSPVVPPYPHSPAASSVPRPESFSMHVHPPPWTASTGSHAHPYAQGSAQPQPQPQGYTSQPMSRDASHQSSHSYQSLSLSNRSLSQGSHRSSQHSYTSQPPHHPAHHQHVRGSNESLSMSSSPSPQTMQRPRSRRPSCVETEPSPRLGPLDSPGPETLGWGAVPSPVVTSYGLYDNARGRRRGGSITAADLPYPVPESSPGFLTRFRSRRRGGGSGSVSSSGAVGIGSDGDGDDESNDTPGSGSGSTGSKGRKKEKVKNKDKTRNGSIHRRAMSAGGRLVRLGRKRDSNDPSASAATAADMMRSASGGSVPSSSSSGPPGFRLADGSVVEFGGAAAPGLPVRRDASRSPLARSSGPFSPPPPQTLSPPQTQTQPMRRGPGSDAAVGSGGQVIDAVMPGSGRGGNASSVPSNTSPVGLGIQQRQQQQQTQQRRRS